MAAFSQLSLPFTEALNGLIKAFGSLALNLPEAMGAKPLSVRVSKGVSRKVQVSDLNKAIAWVHAQGFRVAEIQLSPTNHPGEGNPDFVGYLDGEKFCGVPLSKSSEIPDGVIHLKGVESHLHWQVRMDSALEEMLNEVSSSEDAVCTDIDSRSDEVKPTYSETLRSDLGKAAYRIGANQATSVVRHVAQQTPQGAVVSAIPGVVPFLLGVALPTVIDDERASTMGEELRVKGLTEVGNAIVDSLYHMLPTPREVHVEELKVEEGTEDTQEEENRAHFG